MRKNDLITAIDQATVALQISTQGTCCKRKAEQCQRASKDPFIKVTGQACCGKRVRSEEARQRMAKAQRKRWADKKSADKKAARLSKQS